MKDDVNTQQIVAEQCAELMWPRDLASQGLGIQIERIAPGEAVLSMPVRPDMANGHGTCHGGFLFTLADSAFAFACNSYDQPTVAAAAEISFLQPVHTGDSLRAEAREMYREGRNGVYDVEVRNADGVMVALFRGKSRTIQGQILPQADP
jgi:acyl-CoA thioesterase